MENQGLRAYFFQNMYLTGVHAGIQSQHTTAEMFVKYNMKEGYLVLADWARYHKTTIVLNGGYASNLVRICKLLDNPENPYPWAYFKESEEALNGCLTNVGVILPERVFSADVDYQENYCQTLTDWEVQLAKEVSQCRLMN